MTRHRGWRFFHWARQRLRFGRARRSVRRHEEALSGLREAIHDPLAARSRKAQITAGLRRAYPPPARGDTPPEFRELLDQMRKPRPKR